MKPDPVEQELCELTWRRPLSEAEQARLQEWLARHPESRAEWEADAALSAALARLPQPPAPSNLTARVLAAIDREDFPAAGARQASSFAWLRWVPRLAVVAAILAGGGFWYQHHHGVKEANALAQQSEALATLATVTEGSELPSPEALANFDVILRIHPALQADTELLGMSKQLAEFHKP
jgi:anti-sigma factor RsiW